MAALVIVAHSWWLTGLGPGPAVGGGQLGSWSVVVFFGISGYLITLSRTHARTGLAFFRGRFLRIVPGLAGCLMLIAFVFAPLAAALGPGQYSISDAVSFVLINLSIVGTQITRTHIGSTLSEVPGADEWNSPLWTLFFEVACYLVVGLLAYLKPELFRAAVVLIFSAAIGLLALEVSAHGATAGDWGPVLCPVCTFLAGSLLCLFRTRIYVQRSAVGMALCLLLFSFFADRLLVFCPIPLAYLILVAGSSQALHRIGSRFDISYGMYIYGWPVQQMLVLAGVAGTVSLGAFAILSLAITAPVAWLSCVVIERPAQAFGRNLSSRTWFETKSAAA